MGFVDKVKNFFYEDVDDEENIKIKPEKRIKPDKIKEEKPKKEKREFFKSNDEVSEKTQKISIEYEDEAPNAQLSELELFRSERTFNFPVDMDDDATETFTEKEKDEFFGPTSRLRFDEEPVQRQEVKNESSKTKFRPSPVISPVYGILDRDYNVDDVEEINKGDDHSLNKKIKSYDEVRNKAYKEMDDELEKTLNKSKSIFYNLDEKEEDIPISYGEDNEEAKEVEIHETRSKKNKKVVETSEESEEKADTSDLFNLLDNVTSEEYDDDDE